jgi:transposase
MARAYSMDLREKAVSAMDRGEKKSQICRTLNISRNTLDLWLKRRAEKGTIAPCNYRRGVSPKINDLEAFKAFAQKYGHLTQQEMADKWHQPVSRVLIGQALRKINFTRKKKLTATEKEMRSKDKSLSNISVDVPRRELFILMKQA